MGENLWKEKVRRLKKYLGALYLSLKRKDTPWYAKAFTWLVVAYALSPIDLIPDFIPILGYLDDMILLPAGIYIATKLIPQNILQQCVIESAHIWEEKKPKNWLAAIFFLALWGLLAYEMGKFFLSIMG